MLTSEIFQKARYKGKFSTGDYSEAQMLLDYNQIRKEAQVMLLRSQGYQSTGVDSFATNLVSTTGLTNGDIGYNGEYPLDLSILDVKRIELKMKSTSDYVQAEIYRIADNNYSEFDNLDSTFTEAEPKVKFMRNSILVRPLPTETVANGLRIICATSDTPYYDTSANEVVYGSISDTGDKDTVLNEAFHNYYVYRLCIEYFEREPEKDNGQIRAMLEVIKDEIDDIYSIKFNTPLQMRAKQHSYE